MASGLEEGGALPGNPTCAPPGFGSQEGSGVTAGRRTPFCAGGSALPEVEAEATGAEATGAEDAEDAGAEDAGAGTGAAEEAREAGRGSGGGAFSCAGEQAISQSKDTG